MKVTVQWIKSPRHRFGIPRPPGGRSVIDEKLANEILKIDPKFLKILAEPEKVKDTSVYKQHTRPVQREKKG